MNEKNYFRSAVHNWRIAFVNPKFRILFLIGMILFILLIFVFNVFFQWVQHRNGIMMNDWLLNLVTPVDLSVPIYLVINSLVAFTILVILNNPLRFLQTLYAYLFLSTLRVIIIYFVPLDPPSGIIPLNDPFLMTVAYGQTMITKDLFFSGHIATMLLMLMAAEARWLKWLLFIATLFVAAGILIMRVHYSIDVLAAPVFVLLSWKMSKIFLQRAGK